MPARGARRCARHRAAAAWRRRFASRSSRGRSPARRWPGPASPWPLGLGCDVPHELAELVDGLAARGGVDVEPVAAVMLVAAVMVRRDAEVLEHGVNLLLALGPLRAADAPRRAGV